MPRTGLRGSIVYMRDDLCMDGRQIAAYLLSEKGYFHHIKDVERALRQEGYAAAVMVDCMLVSLGYCWPWERVWLALRVSVGLDDPVPGKIVQL